MSGSQATAKWDPEGVVGGVSDAGVTDPAANATLVAALKGMLSTLQGNVPGGGPVVIPAVGDVADVDETDPAASATLIAVVKGVLSTLQGGVPGGGPLFIPAIGSVGDADTGPDTVIAQLKRITEALAGAWPVPGSEVPTVDASVVTALGAIGTPASVTENDPSVNADLIAYTRGQLQTLGVRDSGGSYGNVGDANDINGLLFGLLTLVRPRDLIVGSGLVTDAAALQFNDPAVGTPPHSTLVLTNVGPDTVYVQPANTVTPATGYPLTAGQVLRLDRSNQTWWGICDVAKTATVSVIYG